MKKALFTVAIALGALQAQAQFPYVFSVQNQTYVPLTGGTSLNGMDLWDDDDYTTPLTFNYMLGDKTTNELNLAFTQIVLSSLTAPLSNGFLVCSADLTDRSNNSGALSPSSPISYQVTGSSPNRIFKMEMSNAGFYDDNANTSSVDYQVWMYEGSNVFEIHFGPTTGTPLAFFENGQPVYAFIKNLDFNTGAVDKVYYLTGNVLVPTLDSTNDIMTIPPGVTSYPPSGTVYRFTPRTTGIDKMPGIAGLQVYPTNTATMLNVETNVAANYTITATNGSKVAMSGHLQAGKHGIDVSALATGVYVLTLENETSRSTVRFTKL